ncbi:MAG: beta-propeller fold lactonase family protein [Armatimonadetes bacterium]|nr:beta-propeller fold lactonase family protein [Armatimonadota bacterium]
MAPDRELQGGSVPIDDPWGISVDTSRDILYVADKTQQAIYVWDNAATVDGNIAPDRTIAMGGDCGDIALDQTNDRLYVCANSDDEIWILNNASTQDGAAAVNRTITATQLGSPRGIELDLSRDRLYVANRGTNGILVFDNVDTINGNVAPLNVISGAATGLDAPIDITLDRERNHIYQVNDTARNHAVRVWHNASGADGNLPPNRVISNSAGLLDRSRALSFISQ